MIQHFRVYCSSFVSLEKGAETEVLITSVLSSTLFYVHESTCLERLVQWKDDCEWYESEICLVL